MPTTRQILCGTVVGFPINAATMDGEPVGPRRTFSMPGVSCTVAEQIEALRRVAGNDAVRLVRREPDEKIARIVAGWPMDFDPRRALDFGFKAETTFDQIIRVHVEMSWGAGILRRTDGR